MPVPPPLPPDGRPSSRARRRSPSRSRRPTTAPAGAAWSASAPASSRCRPSSNGQCGAAEPLKVTALADDLALAPPVTLVCAAAESLARWATEVAGRRRARPRPAAEGADDRHLLRVPGPEPRSRCQAQRAQLRQRRRRDGLHLRQPPGDLGAGRAGGNAGGDLPRPRCVAGPVPSSARSSARARMRRTPTTSTSTSGSGMPGTACVSERRNA